MKNILDHQVDAIAELNDLVNKIEEVKYKAELNDEDVDLWPLHQRMDILENQIEARAEMIARTPYYKINLKCED